MKKMSPNNILKQSPSWLYQVARSKSGLIAYYFFFIAGCIWVLLLCIKSPGTPVQDEIGHYLISKYAWQYPGLILDTWGRPVNTLIYMLPAMGDLLIARLYSILLACLTVLLTTKVAKKMGMHQLFWIPLFLWFQPWFGDLSYTVITEVPFSLCLLLGIYLWITEKYELSGLMFGLLPLIRHEGIALLGLWCLYAILSRRWRALIISILPYVLYNVVYFFVFHNLAINIFINPKPSDFYGQGSWFHFVRPLLYSVGYPITFLAAFSIFSFRNLGKRALIFIVFLAYFLVHTVIYRFGLFESGGYTFFLLPLAPGIAIAAGLGAEWGINQGKKLLEITVDKRIMNLLLAIIFIVIIFFVGRRGLATVPRPMDAEQKATQQAATWLQAEGISSENVISTHVWFYYYYHLPLNDGRLWTRPPDLMGLPKGTIVVWDKHYSDRWQLLFSALANPSKNWRQLAEFSDNTVVIFQKQPGK
jgi:hypothetical protein